MTLENIFLNIKIFCNPHAIICYHQDRTICQQAKEFFNIPIIEKITKEERILLINDEGLRCLLVDGCPTGEPRLAPYAQRENNNE